VDPPLSHRQNSAANLGHDRRLAATGLATEDERSPAAGNVPFRSRPVALIPSLLLFLLLTSDIVSDEAQDVVATFELVAAVAAHRQMLNDLDNARLKQARSRLGQ